MRCSESVTGPGCGLTNTQPSAVLDRTHCPQGSERSHFSLRRLHSVQDNGGRRLRWGDRGSVLSCWSAMIDEGQINMMNKNFCTDNKEETVSSYLIELVVKSLVSKSEVRPLLALNPEFGVT